MDRRQSLSKTTFVMCRRFTTRLTLRCIRKRTILRGVTMTISIGNISLYTSNSTRRSPLMYIQGLSEGTPSSFIPLIGFSQSKCIYVRGQLVFLKSRKFNPFMTLCSCLWESKGKTMTPTDGQLTLTQSLNSCPALSEHPLIPPSLSFEESAHSGFHVLLRFTS